MAEYVTKEQVKEEILSWARCITNPERLVTEDALYIIDALPPADVRPVVFCRECKHSHMTYNGRCKYCDFWQEDGGDALYLPEGFFCAAGERKAGDAE